MEEFLEFLKEHPVMDLVVLAVISVFTVAYFMSIDNNDHG